MSRNPAFCCMAILIFLITIVRSATSGDCSSDGVFDAWNRDEPVPVAAIDLSHWYRASLGWIVAPDACAAREAAVEMAAASEAFERHFAGRVPPGAIVDVEHAGRVRALKDAGAQWVLPWRFERVQEQGDRAEDIRSQVIAQLSAGGREPDPEQVAAIVEQALSRLEAAEPVQSPDPPALEPRAIRHEVAHLLFTEVVWPASGDRFAQYGGDAPDWLDEAAAILAEDAAMTRARRERFMELVDSGGTIPLATYLDMPHPVFADEGFRALIEQAREAAGPDGTTVVSATLAAGSDERALAFYAQTRGFVDYLLERSRNERVIGEVATFMRDEGSFEQWLARRGPQHDLPRDLVELESDFLRYGADRR